MTNLIKEVRGFMENVVNIIAAVIAVYFIVAMLMFFRYLYFKKGSLKKALLHILLSVILLVIVIGVYIGYGKIVEANKAEPGTLTQEMKEILDTKAPEDITFNDLANIVVVSYFPLEGEDKVYLDKIKECYIYYQMNSGVEGRTEEEVANEFDQMRANVEKE